jgi:hypothetical protein
MKTKKPAGAGFRNFRRDIFMPCYRCIYT